MTLKLYGAQEPICERGAVTQSSAAVPCGAEGRAALLEAAGWEAAGLLSAPILWGTAPAAIPSCSEPPHVPQRRAESRAPCRAASSAALRGHRQAHPPPQGCTAAGRRAEAVGSAAAAELSRAVGTAASRPSSSAAVCGCVPAVGPLALEFASPRHSARLPLQTCVEQPWAPPAPCAGLVLSSSARGCRCEFGSSLEGRGAPAGGCRGAQLQPCPAPWG